MCRCCLATRKGDLVRYGRKLLKDDLELWRDPEVISEVLGLAEDTEHRGDILVDIEAKFTEAQVGQKLCWMRHSLSKQSLLLWSLYKQQQHYQASMLI